MLNQISVLRTSWIFAISETEIYDNIFFRIEKWATWNLQLYGLSLLNLCSNYFLQAVAKHSKTIIYTISINKRICLYLRHEQVGARKGREEYKRMEKKPVIKLLNKLLAILLLPLIFTTQQNAKRGQGGGELSLLRENQR